MDHHNDSQFFSTSRAGGFGKGLQTFQTYFVIGNARYEELDQASFPGFEVAEEQDAAAAFNVDQFTGTHRGLRISHLASFVYQKRKPRAKARGFCIPIRDYCLDKALVAHSVGNLEEAGDVCALDVVCEAFFVCAVGAAGFVDVSHNAVELLIDFSSAPVEAH